MTDTGRERPIRFDDKMVDVGAPQLVGHFRGIDAGATARLTNSRPVSASRS